MANLFIPSPRRPYSGSSFLRRVGGDMEVGLEHGQGEGLLQVTVSHGETVDAYLSRAGALALRTYLDAWLKKDQEKT